MLDNNKVFDKSKSCSLKHYDFISILYTTAICTNRFHTWRWIEAKDGNYTLIDGEWVIDTNKNGKKDANEVF